jgi:hypothetical protein
MQYLPVLSKLLNEWINKNVDIKFSVHDVFLE